jgi:crotonobetainyl-CoA:carnitine CoA-transferase CaiB-like acyl-CoA transferase
MPTDSASGPLAGLRVIDCSTVLAGPLTCQILGDHGADVIKVEHPTKGDSLRGHGAQKDGHGLWWKMVSRNKRCIGLNLGDPDGAAVFERLVATADVVVENFRPGTLERWGLGWDRLSQIRPELVLCRITGFGQDGPYAGRPAFGTLIEAMSGFAHVTGEADGPPTLPPFGLADSIAGLAASSGILMALRHRDETGVGQVVDQSILEPMMTTLGPYLVNEDQLGIVQQRQGNRSSNNAPRNTYRTADGHWVAVSSSADAVARRALELVGHPEVVDEPWFATGAGRAEHGDLIDEHVGSWIGERDLETVVDAFVEADVALAPVYDAAQLAADPQVVARDMVTTVDDPDLGPMRMQNTLFRLSESPGKIRWTGRSLGADTDAVLVDELGLSADEVAELREREVVA